MHTLWVAWVLKHFVIPDRENGTLVPIHPSLWSGSVGYSGIRKLKGHP